MPETRQWTALVPLKDSQQSKSRMAAALGLNPAQTRRLATAMASDVVDACLASIHVDQVAIVTPNPTLFQPDRSLTRLTEMRGAADLNAILTAAVYELRAARPHVHVVIVLADLGCLRSDSVDRLCASAPTGARGFVRDYSGSGTTMMFIPAAERPNLAFGPNSAANHSAAQCHDLTEFARPDARLDLDTAADLVIGTKLGFGDETRRLLTTR